MELLDKVLSEFEEEQENTQAGEPESPSQGHQSEDDGYMSMNGRRYEDDEGCENMNLNLKPVAKIFKLKFCKINPSKLNLLLNNSIKNLSVAAHTEFYL